MSKVEEQKAPYSGKFQIKKDQLVEIAAAGQERNFSEEVDLLEKYGGEEWLEQGLFTNYEKGLDCHAQRQPKPNETPEETKKYEGLPGEILDWDERNQAFDSNLKPEIPPKGFCGLLYEALNDFTLKILMVAAVVNLSIEMGTAETHELSHKWIDGAAILIAILVCSMVAAVNDYEKEKQFQVLNKVADDRKTVTVIRNGQEANVHQDFVMVGDVVKLSEGMEIPADGIVLQAADLTTDESAMTGETDPIKKNVLSKCIADRQKIIDEGNKNTAGKHDVSSPLIMSGTRILTGEGKMVVVVVGDSSCLGKISAILRTKEDVMTPLQEKLNIIAEDIGKFGLVSAIVIIFVMLIRFMIERLYTNEFETEHINEILSFFIIGITVVVVAIPEGLPLAVTLSLAFSVKKMLKDQNLVRKLQACETMGGANNICSDKTGTLTENVMTLIDWWNVETTTFPQLDKDQKYNLEDFMSPQFKELFLVQTAINCSATMHPEEKGSKTETAILKFLMKTPHDYRELRKQYEEIRKFPFSSSRKRMSTIVNLNGKQVMFIKGASEMVLQSCDRWQNRHNCEINSLGENQIDVVKRAIKTMADNALRTICIGYKELNGNEDLETKDQHGVYTVEQSGFIMMGIFGIADVIRKEVPGAVQQCITAGIKVRMVTGDNKDTARAIALQCHIIDPNNKEDMVIEGKEFIEMTGGVVCKKCGTFECDCARDAETAKKEGKDLRVDTIKNGEAFDKLWPHMCVMARSRPEDKYAMVTGLIERGHVVAVTGDGTNDAPALKKADVGFAMGIAGTAVARDAADIILLDDNFKSIVQAVKWGRNIYDSIQKFLQFQLTVNVVAVSMTLAGAALIKQEILTPIQMLWVNLIMDTFASLALATEPPSDELLLRKPHNRSEYIISKKMAKHIIGQSFLQMVIVSLIVFAGEKFLPEWKTDALFDDLPDKIKDHTKELDPDEIARDPQIRYLTKFPYKLQFQTEDEDYVVSGRLKSYNGIHNEYYFVEKLTRVPSRHFTYAFNVFVLLQVFNFLNARKLKDEFNVFEGITKNLFFPAIIFIIIAFQIFVITIGGSAFHCFSYWGLNIQQWLICIGFGITSVFWSVIIKMIPEEKIFNCSIFTPTKIIEDPIEAGKSKGGVQTAGGQNGEINIQNNETQLQQNGNNAQQQDSYAKQVPEDNEAVEQRDEQQVYNENQQ